ncbi:GntR family transcriptional regulator, partial [Streptomyces sp. NPDC017638]
MIVSRSGDPVSARERVYLYLRQQITTGEFSGGTRLTEEQIADELGVSRTPIREA